MSGLTNTTMTALKVAMAVAMTFHRGTVQQCGGVPFDQLADPDSTITARLASTADKTSVQNTPHTHPPSTGTHPHTCMPCIISCLLLMQTSQGCQRCTLPWSRGPAGRKVDTGRQQARVPRWDEEDGGGCWTCLQHKSATAARLSNLAAPVKTSCANLLEDTGGGYLPQQLECQQLIRRLTSFASQPIICFLSRRVWILSVTGVPIETTITPPTNTYCHNLPVFTPAAKLVMAK